MTESTDVSRFPFNQSMLPPFLLSLGFYSFSNDLPSHQTDRLVLFLEGSLGQIVSGQRKVKRGETRGLYTKL